MRKIETNVTLRNGKQITAHQVANDRYGNPRYVIHYSDVADTYSDALRIASRTIAGRKYTGKWYDEGIVFWSCYSLKDTLEYLLERAGKL